MPDELPEFLTVKQVAGLLQLNQQTIYNWITDGTLPHTRAGRRIRIRREDFQALAGAQGVAEADDLITVAEIAEMLGLNQQTIRNWIDAGSLEAVRVGRRVRIRRGDLDAVMIDTPARRGSTRTAVTSAYTATDFWDGTPPPGPVLARADSV